MGEAPGVERYFREFETSMKALGGRPHWGKEFRSSPAELTANYPGFQRFSALARELDPRGVFRNPFVARLLDDAEDHDPT
jgi:FAD/FMN-containing dehydrogenase